MRLLFSSTKRGSCSICKNTVDKLMSANWDLAKKDLFSKPLSIDEFLIGFRKQYAIEIWALKVQRNYQIFKDALQQIGIMLLGTADASIIAIEIPSGLERTQMALLSCGTEVTKRSFPALANCSKSREWTEEEQADFSRKFTCSVPGLWGRKDILDSWDKLVKVRHRNM
jgi:hypothetical protein